MDRLRDHWAESAIASVTWHEALYGMRRLPSGSQRRLEVQEYLLDVVGPALPVLEYDAAAADWHAEERARLTRGGRTPSWPDGQIAAIAAVRGLTLVTANVADFSAFLGLSVEDWTG